jgi:hypothetical protein
LSEEFRKAGFDTHFVRELAISLLETFPNSPSLQNWLQAYYLRQKITKENAAGLTIFLQRSGKCKKVVKICEKSAFRMLWRKPGG